MSKVSIRVERIDPFLTSYPSMVKCVESGVVTEFICLAKKPHEFKCQKIDKDHYINLETNEVFEYHHSEDKSGCYQSVRRTLASLRSIINANCLSDKNIRFITLTYADNMTDVRQLYKDFDRFWKRFKRFSIKVFSLIPKYICVAEPQGRGAWHLHLILIFPDEAPYLDNNGLVWAFWEHGFTKTEAVHGVDNLGAYFSAYLADMPLEEFKALSPSFDLYQVKTIDKFYASGSPPADKKFVKGARLCLYPAGMNIYRTSRDILRPSVSFLSSKDFEQKKASSGKLTFSHGCSLYSVDEHGQTEHLNTISHFYYNKFSK